MLEIKDLTIQYGEKDAVVENFSLTMKRLKLPAVLSTITFLLRKR